MRKVYVRSCLNDKPYSLLEQEWKQNHLKCLLGRSGMLTWSTIRIIRFHTSESTTVRLSAACILTSADLLLDGVNGRLPNLDLVNSAAHIARWIGGVPVRLHNDTYEDQLGGSLSLDNWKPRYSQRARGILNQVRYGMTTQPSGPEGLFGQ
jgi:hypothetical protein